MAELLLKVRDGSQGRGGHQYLDGDVLCAFSRLRIRCCHAQHICHVKEAGFNRDGLRPATSLAKIYREEVSEYLFRRITRTTVERVRLADNHIDTLGPETMDLDLYLSRRLQHARHGIFGATGREFWYGGRTTIDHARMDTVWAAIESNSPNLEVDHQLWPMGIVEGKHHLFIQVNDMTEDEVADLEREKYDKTDEEFDTEYISWRNGGRIGPRPTRTLLRRRQRKIDWRGRLALSARSQIDILNRDLYVDRRTSSLHDRSTVVEERQ